MSPSGCASIHEGYRTLANQTPSERVAIRLLAVTNDERAVFRRTEIGSSRRPVNYPSIGLG
jgi:hypothetical protein